MAQRQGSMATPPRFEPLAFAQNLVLRGLIGLLRAIPYRWRVPLGGWIVARIVAPLAGYDKRVRDNLALVLPDLPTPEVARLIRAVPANAGRLLIEGYSGAAFRRRALTAPVRGAGEAAVMAALARGQAMVMVSGHFGNYDVPRALLTARGFRIGVLYKPFTNRYFDAHYRKMLARISGPIFPRGRQGLGAMVRHLRGGGQLAILIDQHSAEGAPLTFFGKRAMTALSAAELALKYDCLLVPVYGLRQPDGLSFEVIIEPPIPPATPEAMTQALNDSLEAITRRHPEQWFWIHRRWK